MDSDWIEAARRLAEAIAKCIRWDDEHVVWLYEDGSCGADVPYGEG